MERMETIDFKKITAEAAKEMAGISVEFGGWRPGRFVMCKELTPEQMGAMLLERVWERCLEELNGSCPDAGPLGLEKALSELKGAGDIKDDIVFKSGSFRFRLQNGRYRAYRSYSGDAFRACPWPADRHYWVRLSGNCFASFIRQFDAAVPEMLETVPRIMEDIRNREWEETRARIERELKDKVIRTVIDASLTPLGLAVRYSLGEQDMVSMEVTLMQSAHLEIPLWQLHEKLQDPAFVMAALRTDPPAEVTDDDEESL